MRSIYGRVENAFKILYNGPEGKNPFVYLGINARIILKWILQMKVCGQGRLNVTAHPAAVGGLASTSFKISKNKNQIFLLPFYLLTKSLNSIVRD
jgi:hypothetical protein